MSSSVVQLDLLSQTSSESGTRVSRPKRVSYSKLSNEELIALKKQLSEDYGFAREKYLNASRYEKSKYDMEMRGIGQKIGRVQAEMGKRGLRNLPRRVTGRKGDCART